MPQNLSFTHYIIKLTTKYRKHPTILAIEKMILFLKDIAKEIKLRLNFDENIFKIPIFLEITVVAKLFNKFIVQVNAQSDCANIIPAFKNGYRNCKYNYRHFNILLIIQIILKITL